MHAASYTLHSGFRIPRSVRFCIASARLAVGLTDDAILLDVLAAHGRIFFTGCGVGLRA